MQIKSVQFTNDQQGSPAIGFAYYIGLPNQDPIQEANRLTVKDEINGAVTSNPFYVNVNGLFINANGQRINPWIDEEEYSLKVLSPGGGVLCHEPRMTSDRVRSGDFQSSVVDAVFNNFDAAKNANLTGYETIYIESLNSGWEDTIAGPVDGFYAHSDGTTGTPSSGTPASFFDSVGNGWRQDDSQRIGEDDVSTILIQDLAVTTAKINNSAVTSGKIADLNVTNAKIANNTLTRVKQSDVFGIPFQIDTITANGTYNVPASAKGLRVTCIGGGGGGSGTNNPITVGGYGGGSGATSIKYITSPSSSYSVTVGAGGTAGATFGNGGSGGDTSFGVVCIAKGGNGAGYLIAQASGGSRSGSTGDIRIAGNPGSGFTFQDNTFAYLQGGNGGGAGGGVSVLSAAQANSGGGGAGGGGTAGGVGSAGFAGAAGIIIVEVF